MQSVAVMSTLAATITYAAVVKFYGLSQSRIIAVAMNTDIHYSSEICNKMPLFSFIAQQSFRCFDSKLDMFASHDHHKVVKKIPGLHQTSFCSSDKVIVALKQLLMQLHTITAALSSSSNNADVPMSLPLSDNILFVFHFLLLLLVCSYGTALKPNTTITK